MTERLELFKQLVLDVKEKNPYPQDVFVGKTKEGRIGHFGFNIWNLCCETIIQAITDVEEELEK